MELFGPDSTIPAPVVTYSDAKPSKQYELVMVDYDKLRMGKDDWLLWNVEMVPGRQLIEGFSGIDDVDRGS